MFEESVKINRKFVELKGGRIKICQLYQNEEYLWRLFRIAYNLDIVHDIVHESI